MINISSNFEGGNIELVEIADNNIQLLIKDDNNSDEKQWFYFQAAQVKNQPCNFDITNAHAVSYPEAWPTCTIVYSYDRKNWLRLDTNYDDKTLSFSLTPSHDIVYFALFTPYSYQQHLDLIAYALTQDKCQLEACGQSVFNRPVELLKIGNDSPSKKRIWIISRQHPAETMAEWFAEGMLETLLNSQSKDACNLLEQATVYIVPNMNPDGSVLGNLRTNGAGVDLNRSWLRLDPDKEPESYFVFKQMQKIGVDLFLDIHGDEDIPYAFFAGTEGIKDYSKQLAHLDKNFREVLSQITPDFSKENGYEPSTPDTVEMGVATNRVAQHFNCLSLTLEMPFTDNKYQPDKEFGWSAYRSKSLATDIIKSLNIIMPTLNRAL